MKEEIIKEIADDISESYKDLLINGFEEEEKEFPISICVVEFIISLKEKGIIYKLDDIFISTFLDKMIIEANRYVGR